MPHGRLTAALHLGLLLSVPAAAILFLHAPLKGAADDHDREIAQRVLQRPFLTSDLEEIAAVEQAMSRLQSTRSQQLAQLDAVSSGKDRQTGSPLNLWDRIERTALRQGATLDYFLGFSY